mmetsp:Transcript_43431/g.104838  ORF Transcript_43431/g.104838 Transcript_43431/m.104838 type:complete len:244 (+) Transcript_43431:710-1441(+)
MRHHDLRVLPVRVCDERQLLARLPLVQEGEGQLRVELHVPPRVAHHVRLQPPLHVCLEQRLGDRVEEHLVRKRQVPPRALVAHLELAVVPLLHELDVEAPLRHAEQGVQKDEALALPQIHMLPAVDLVHLPKKHPPAAVHRPPHFAKPVDLHHVAKVFVDDEPSANERGVKLQIVNRETDLAEVLLGVVVGPPLPLLHLVVNQSVVHIVPYDADGAEVEGLAAEYRPLWNSLDPPALGDPPVV